MEREISAVGGAQIGWISATWPFAQLLVSKSKLTLSCLGKYEFEPQQIAEIEPHGSIPFLARGVRIVHTRADYPARLIFWCFGSPESLLSRIRAVGFVAQASRTALPRREGMPLKWAAVIAIVVVWNMLFLLDHAGERKPPGEFGWPTLLAIGLLCATAWSLPQSPFLQSLVLKPDRSMDEIKAFVWLLRLVSTLMFVAFTTITVTRLAG